MIVSFRFALPLLILGSTSLAQAEVKKPSLAGWYDILPHDPFFLNPHFETPTLEKGKDGEPIYSQSATYSSATGLPRGFRITLARNPDFKKQFHPDALKALAEPPSEKMIGKRRCLVWKDEMKMVIPMGNDKAVIFEAMFKTRVGTEGFAATLDFERIAKALAKPPRTDFTLTPESFAVFKKNDHVFKLREWCGNGKLAELDKATNRWSWSYDLKDGTMVAVITVKGLIEAIRHTTNDGKTVELLN